MVTTTAGALRDAAGTFFGRLTDAKSGASEISRAAQLAASLVPIDASIPDATLVDIPLHQNPPIRILPALYRNIGWDGSANVPLFFQQRGVHRPPPPASSLTPDSSPAQIAAVTEGPPKGNRLLRAVDIMVHQPRAALTSSITITPSGIVTGLGFANQTLAERAPTANDVLKMQVGTFSGAGNPSLDFQGADNVMTSNYEEKNWDEILVSTVYLLSPAGTPPGSVPDSSWQAFTKHSIFWNLSWQQPALNPFINTDAFRPILGVLSVLGGGAGFLWASSVASSLNDATQGALNILQSQSLAGSFWSPTGGGVDSTLPAEPTPAAKKTLDKKANNLSAALAAAKLNNSQLDPSFPFSGIGFNLSLVKK
jgi:hypothetical protein